MASIFISSKSIHHDQKRYTTEIQRAPRRKQLRSLDMPTSPPSGLAKTCRFPVGRAHSPPPPGHRRMLLQIVLDCDPALLWPAFGLWARPSNHISAPEPRSWLEFRRSASFPFAATF